MESRLEKLRERLEAIGVEAFLVSSPESRRYLSGFTGSAGYLLVSRDNAVLSTDFRYTEQAAEQAPGFQVERIKGSLEWFPDLCSRLKVKTVGFEGSDISVNTYQGLVNAIKDSGSSDIRLKSTNGLVERIRGIKDSKEIELLARAVEIADQAIDEIGPTIEPGQTEAEVAWKLEKAMRERGAEALSFDIIVGAGPNGALPHHRAADVAIGNGEPVVIDMGCKYQGYCSDLTRTLFVGEPDHTFRKVYDLVLGAQLAAEATLEGGMTAGDVDKLARSMIEEAGYGENFGHGLGHGVGLAIHEYPPISPNSEAVMEDGMVFTVEPGIYISGWGGVRIEDVAVLESGRARVLSKARKIDKFA